MSAFNLCVQFLKDVKWLGLGTTLRAARRNRPNGTMALDLGKFGKVLVRCGDSDYETLRQNLRDREYAVQADVQARLNLRYQEILDTGGVPVVIDAGANIGAATLWFRSVFPEAAIAAVEPDPGNIEILKINLAASAKNIVLPAAIGCRSGFAKLSNYDRSWAVQSERAEEGCPIITVDEIVAGVPNGVLFLVKIDIEGFEDDLFSENLAWVKNACAVFVEPHDWMKPGCHTSQNFQRALANDQFEIFLRGENLLYVRYA